MSVLRAIQQEDRAAAPSEQQVLARWSGWGAVPAVFDPKRDELAWAREELSGLLSEQEMAAAARNTLNAHYTDAALIQVIWNAVRDLGFTGGQVLEPGCGSGNFIGFAPAGALITGVELDPVTAGIAAALYPDARIQCESFADTSLPDGFFDLAIGNVPFAPSRDIRLTDKRHNPGQQHSLHNHFIIKSLHLTRPGGLVAVLTSRYTMDSKAALARHDIARLADLVGAIRLPSGAHQRAAGTAAVTDLLILRRREDGRTAAPSVWEETRIAEIDGAEVPINAYFLDHPDLVLGEMRAVHGPKRDGDLSVRKTGNVTAALRQALQHVTREAARQGLTWTPAAGPADSAPLAAAEHASRPDGYLRAHPDGAFTQLADGREVDFPVPASQGAELRQLLRLRDIVLALLEAEAATGDDTTELDRLRRGLNLCYDTYVRAYGPVSRFTWRRTGRTDQETGEEKQARIRPPQGGFRTDPFAPAVLALEQFDPVSQRAGKAAIFTRRVVAPRNPRLGADNPADALAICLDLCGEVRLPAIAQLLGNTAEEARQALGALVYEIPPDNRGDADDLIEHVAADLSAITGFSLTGADITGQSPATVPAQPGPPPGTLVPAAEYLSGNVRQKLAIAEAAARDDPRFAVNVTALREVVPAGVGPAEITAQLGAAWIDSSYVQQFLREILDTDTVQVEHPGGPVWTVVGPQHGVLATSTWGTARYPAPHLAQAILEQRLIQVRDTIGLPGGSKRSVLNPDETLAAQEKAAELSDRFSEWIWEDPERAAHLARVYNDKFNSIVLRSYDDAQLSLPGLALSFEPHPHQVAAVARIINEPAVGLFHEVGAGKTAEMVMGAMELRRLGLARKPAIIVPNHMLEQFSREFLQLYPQAQILVTQKEDLRADRRRLFVARCATGEWDAIIISHSAFERIPLSAEAQEHYMTRELGRIRDWIQRSRESGELSVKRLQAMLLSAEEKLKAKLDSAKDPGVTFEATGIDYLFTDEAHLFKNLRTLSNIQGAGIEGSMRASDLDMKIGYLREKNGARVVTFATATPIANSVTEAHVMQRYLRPDLLETAGTLDFDAWAGTFGETVTEIELAPEGGSSFRQATRFAKFRNVPEMLRMFHVAADIKTAEDLHLPVPEIARRPDGKRAAETVPVDPSDAQMDVIAELGTRADKIRNGLVRPDEDNMVSVCTDGRQAALDLRLLSQPMDVPGKIGVAADRIAAIWEAHRDDVYPGPDGRPHPVRGSLQIVFCDLGTPKTGWNVYHEMRAQIVARGLPRQAIRFIHEAATDQQKGELFAACRAGNVAVLIGTTAKMGVGTNVQDRAVALHHLDAPWRPADVAQREGRILRQGNRNSEVQILRYVTERSFDGYMWQTLERKAKFINQIMRGRLDVREIEDIGDVALSYNEVKALATGNPLLIDKAKADAELTRLERAARAHRRNQDFLQHTITRSTQRAGELTSLIPQIDQAIAQRKDTRGDAFTMTVGGRVFGKRGEAGKALKELLLGEASGTFEAGQSRKIRPGEFGGFPLTGDIRAWLGQVEIILELDGAPGTALRISRGDLAKASASGLVTKLENRLHGLEETKTRTLAEIDHLRGEADRAAGDVGKPFAQADDLTAARAQGQQIAEQLQAMASESERNGQVEHDPPEEREPSAAPDSEPEPDGQAEHDPTGHSEPSAAPDTDRVAPSAVASHQDHGGRRPGLEREQPGSPGAPEPPGGAGQPPPEPAALVIEHGQPGTLVHGTGQRDRELHNILKHRGFRFSPRLNAWYLPRPWAYSTREARVSELRDDLRRLGRDYSMADPSQSPGPSGTPSPVPETAPPAKETSAAQDASLAVTADDDTAATADAAASPDAAAGPPLVTQPAAGERSSSGRATGPEASAVPARHKQTRQDGGATARPAVPVGSAAAPGSSRSADPAPPAPAACRTVSDLRQVAAVYGLSIHTDSSGSRGTQLTVVRDNGRTVLLHDDISGTKAGGYRLDPGEVPAYLAAYARYPQLPARALAELARPVPAGPGILTLTGAREIAARHGLDVRIRRAGRQSYITICEPGITGPPVLSYPAGIGLAYHGPCAVPAATVNGYLFTYRDSVPPALFTVPAAAPPDWARRAAQLTPHLVNGSGHFIRGVRDHLRAALTAARSGDTDEARRLLGLAEIAAPPLTPTPEREAELAGVINAHAGRYGRTDDPAAYIRSSGRIDASDREWAWVRSYISAHPGVCERTPQDTPASEAVHQDADRQAAASKSSQAKKAFENGHHEQALALLDEGELLYPDRGVHWDAARQQIRDAMKQAHPAQPPDQDALDPEAPAGNAHAGTEETGPAAGAPDGRPPITPGNDATGRRTAAGSGASARTPAAHGAHDEANVGSHPPRTQPARPDPVQQTETRAPGQPGTAGTGEPATATPAGHYEADGAQPHRQGQDPSLIGSTGASDQLASDATAGSGPQQPGHSTTDDAPATDNAKAGQVVAAARRRAETRDQAHVPIDYARANAMVRRQRAALTRATSSGDPAKVILAAQKAVSEWDQPGMAWPDDWSRWQRALDDALPDQHIRLEDMPAAPAPDAGTPRTGNKSGQNAGATDPVATTAQGKPAQTGDPQPAAAPVTNSDLAIALRHLSGWEFARFITQAGTPGQAGSRSWRRDGDPDAGANEELDWDASGVDITIRAPGIRRHGHVSWPQIASWIDAGMTPARFGLIVTASRLYSFCRSHREELIAAGKCDPGAAVSELARTGDAGIGMVITAALSTRGAAAPVPPALPGKPSYHTAAMVTRPDPAAGKEENAALERLAQLRAVIREPQPISAAGVKTTIRRWIGDGLPDYVRALGKPAKMRAWINGQVTTRASRPVRVTYDTPGISGGRWYGASPEGLLTERSGDDRAETLIPWEEIPAWIQPGITTSLRNRLLTADDSHRAVIRQRLTAAVHPQANLAEPGGQEDEQAARLRREAITAAWAAIEAAPPPAPAQLEHARRTYRDTSPVQKTLLEGPELARQQDDFKGPPDDPAAPGPPSVPAEPSPAAHPSDTAPGVTAGSTRPEPSRQQDASAPTPVPAVTGTRRQQQDDAADAARPQPGSTGTPLSANDIFLGLSRLPHFVFADLISAIDGGQPLDSVSRQLAPYSGKRTAGEPDTGAREAITPAPGGLRIKVAAGHGTRAGLLSWAEIANWLRPGLTPARRQIACRATEIRLRFTMVSASFRAVGEAGLADEAEQELRNLASAAVSAVLDAAHTGRIGRGGQQSLPADDEAAALQRIEHLASALPGWPPRWDKPVSQVQTGDIIGHPSYKLQPFAVSAPPEHHDDRVEITGHLTSPAEGEPAGETTWALARTREADPVVRVVPLPARSLRRISAGPPRPRASLPGLSQHSAAGNGPQPRPSAVAAGTTRADGLPAGSAPPGAPIPMPADAAGTSQSHSTATGTKEETSMPPAPPSAPVPAITTGPGPAGNSPPGHSPAGARVPGPQAYSTEPSAHEHDRDARLQQELEDVLTAITEHRRTTTPNGGSAGDDFADIRAAFATLRNALEVAAPAGHRSGSGPHPADPAPGPAAAEPSPAAVLNGLSPQAGDFADIRAAFADLRRVLDLPARGRHSRDSGPQPAAAGADPAGDRLLDQAAAEAQACARWYRDTPEWQRITTVGRAARNLITTIQAACGDYWDEIRQDIRVRGFTRTLAARACLAVSGAAHILSARIERAGHQDTRIWRAAWGLHRATATFADRIMRYTPPEHPGRMKEARQIISDLGQRPPNSRRPEASRVATPGSRGARPPSPVTLANASFPVPVSQATECAAAGPASRTATAPQRQPHAARRV